MIAPKVRALCLSAVLTALLVAPAAANPLGGVVTAGSARIDQSAAGLTAIHQATDRAIINWQSFSNSSGQVIRFNQPSVSAVTLNRVIGTDPSVLAGGLQANGRVFLINPAGVLFTSTATVDTAGLVASTLGIKDSDFLAGHYAFAQDPSKALAAVINQGKITARNSGQVVLIAPLVNNSGQIVAALGKVAIAGTTRAVVDIDGQGLIHLDIGPTGHGDVVMPASAASADLRRVAGSSQIVEAGAVVEKNGVVTLRRAEGLVTNFGTISTDGAAGQKAGQVVMNSSQATVLAPSSVITANGRGASSSGGHVAVLSQGHTHVAAGSQIAARGGNSGDGGAVEISGSTEFVRGAVDTGATDGKGGTVLLDPVNLQIKWNGGGTLDTTFNTSAPPGQILATDGAGTQSIDVATLEGFISSQIVLQAQRNITLDSSTAEGGNGVLLLQPNTSITLQTVGTGLALANIRFANINDTIQTRGTGTITIDSGSVGTNLAGITVGKLVTQNQSISLTSGSGTIPGTVPGSRVGAGITFNNLHSGTGSININSRGGGVFVGGINTDVTGLTAASTVNILAFNSLHDISELSAGLGHSNVHAGALILEGRNQGIGFSRVPFDGIGSAAAPINISAATLGVNSRGNATIVQTGGLTLANVTVGKVGDPFAATLNLKTSGGNLTIDPGVGDQLVQATGNIILNATGGSILTANNNGPDFQGLGGGPIALQLTASGTIGTGANPLGMTVASVDATANGGGVFLSPGGPITLNKIVATFVNESNTGDVVITSGGGNITVNSVTAGLGKKLELNPGDIRELGGAVTIITPSGSILSGDPSVTNVTTFSNLVLGADAIGTAAKPLITASQINGQQGNLSLEAELLNLQAFAKTGGLFMTYAGKGVLASRVIAAGEVNIASTPAANETNGGDILVQSITGSTVTLNAFNGQKATLQGSGSIFAINNGSSPNIVATGNGANTLTATGVIIGTGDTVDISLPDNVGPSLAVNIAGTLAVSAQGQESLIVTNGAQRLTGLSDLELNSLAQAVSVLITGVIKPLNQLRVLNSPPGAVLFNPAIAAATDVLKAATVLANKAAQSGQSSSLVFLPSGQTSNTASEKAGKRPIPYGELKEMQSSGCSLTRSGESQPSPLSAALLLAFVGLLAVLRRREGGLDPARC